MPTRGTREALAGWPPWPRPRGRSDDVQRAKVKVKVVRKRAANEQIIMEALEEFPDIEAALICLRQCAHYCKLV